MIRADPEVGDAAVLAEGGKGESAAGSGEVVLKGGV